MRGAEWGKCRGSWPLLPLRAACSAAWGSGRAPWSRGAAPGCRAGGGGCDSRGMLCGAGCCSCGQSRWEAGIKAGENVLGAFLLRHPACPEPTEKTSWDKSTSAKGTGRGGGSAQFMRVTTVEQWKIIGSAQW